MARYTRAEILHLRDSPIIVFHTPPLPDWISPEAITTAAQNKNRPAERQAPTRTSRIVEDSTSASTRSRADKQDGLMLRSGRQGTDRVRGDRIEANGDDFTSKRRSQRTDGQETSNRESEDDLGRSTRRTEFAKSLRGARKIVDHEEPPDRLTKSGRSEDPEWFAQGARSNDDSAAGKTVDDFERWKQSMKKNDQTTDAGLPPLESTALDAEDTTAKDVRPPPGFAGVTPKPPAINDNEESSLINSLFSAKASSETKPDNSHGTLPPGFPANVPSTQPTTNKSAGASKFSKFFGQSSGPITSSTESAEKQQSGTTANGIPTTLSASKSSGKTDDAEGFERILAMLSSQGISKNMTSNAKEMPVPQFSQPQDHINRPPVANESAKISPAAWPMQANHAMRQEYPDASQAQKPFPSNLYEQRHGYGPYSPDRQTMPSMRDGTSGPSAIMSHHTQNQDFFSSLLSQSQMPASDSTSPYRGTSQAPFDLLTGPKEQPSRHQRPDYMHRLNSQERIQRAPYDAQSQYHPGQGPQPPFQGRGDNHEFLSQLMAEQRNSGSQYSFGPYAAHPQRDIFPERGPVPGFAPGIASRSGPAWNGQHEMDPRVPNASQYRA